ncbi:tellurite resistance TerB family protein [Marinomonas sp. M1K-6]|uniref:Tellurite resistance TerB family protein n=1 Tax=Marinomonas profundi TaxID=2726122 RepID=A0A847R7F1_9GAMM|nr:tellurite resistance TerB family protein [Marinomonas profundi]NLQ18413.1 tellurite resistance TerB family protein [Marinomonas profundi]UDV02467.1 tellurite resistance TerB family protein [Marinomonas profundi]
MNINSLLGSIMGSAGSGIDKAVTKAKSGSMPGGLMGGAAAGGLAAMLLTNKKARKMGGQAIKYGGMAAIGGMAYKAWRDHKESQNAPTSQTTNSAPNQSFQSAPSNALPTVPAGSIFDLAEEQPSKQAKNIHLILIRAMISAAKADGHIDTSERARIEQQISDLGISAEEQQFLIEQLRATSDPITIARLSESEEQATEIYLVSMLAIDIDTEEERRYLDRLGDALHLPTDLRQNIEHEVKNAQIA